MVRKLAAIIACHNRKPKTLRSLQTFFEQLCPTISLEVYLYDDGSTDGSREAIAKRYPDVVLEIGSGVAYWAGGMRSVFSRAAENDFDFYLWLNDDVELFPDAVLRLVSLYDELHAKGHSLSIISGAVSDPETGLTTYGGIKLKPGFLPLRFRKVIPDPNDAVECDTLLGNVVLIPRTVVRTVGVIGAEYKQTLGDLDYGLRVRAASGHVYLAAGHVGTCPLNEKPGIWFRSDLSLRERWSVVGQPLGFPPRPWLSFVMKHGGLIWPLLFILPYWRLMVPGRLVKFVEGLRRSG